jgi:hypothetical protein
VLSRNFHVSELLGPKGLVADHVYLLLKLAVSQRGLEPLSWTGSLAS